MRLKRHFRAKETEAFYHEALARSYSDWLVGINTSQARVQTPVLCLIRQREEDGNEFEAHLQLNKEHKLEFSFLEKKSTAKLKSR